MFKKKRGDGGNSNGEPRRLAITHKGPPPHPLPPSKNQKKDRKDLMRGEEERERGKKMISSKFNFFMSPVGRTLSIDRHKVIKEQNQYDAMKRDATKNPRFKTTEPTEPSSRQSLQEPRTKGS